MSGTILSTLASPLSASDFGAIDQAQSASQSIESTIAALTAQTTSGYVATTYAGLGANAGTALGLSTQIAQADALQTSTGSAADIQQAAQTALGQIESIAANFASQALTLQTVQSGAPALAQSANAALVQVAQLLDTQVGGVYVFAGQDSATPPVPDPGAIAQSGFTQAISAAIAALGTNGAAATSAATLAIAAPGGTSPFSPSLEANGAQAEADLGQGVRVKLAPLATTNSDAASPGTGTTSTGSYTRDILLGLASLASLGNATTGTANFSQLVQTTTQTLNGAVSAITTDIAALGARQQQVSSVQSELASASTALKTQLSGLQDADLTQVATQLSQAQTQLQASFQIIAALSQETLSKFLPT